MMVNVGCKKNAVINYHPEERVKVKDNYLSHYHPAIFCLKSDLLFLASPKSFSVVQSSSYNRSPVSSFCHLLSKHQDVEIISLRTKRLAYIN